MKILEHCIFPPFSVIVKHFNSTYILNQNAVRTGRGCRKSQGRGRGYRKGEEGNVKVFGLFPGGEDSPPRREQESKQGGIPASTLQDGLGKMNRQAPSNSPKPFHWVAGWEDHHVLEGRACHR